MIYLPGGKALIKNGKLVTSAGDCCCDPCQTCAGSTCLNCPDGITPNAFSILFGAVNPTPRCALGGGTVYHLYADLSGNNYTLPQTATPCRYELDVTGVVGIERCAGAACGDCSGGVDVVTAAKLVITVGLGPAPAVTIELTYVDPGGLGAGALTVVPYESSHDPATRVCCDVTTIVLKASDGAEDPIASLVDGGYAISPC